MSGRSSVSKKTAGLKRVGINRRESISRALGGPHHCIGTAQTVIDTVFQYLFEHCDSPDGSLSKFELIAAKADLVKGFMGMPEFFEDIHSRCMNASDASHIIKNSDRKILSSLLVLASQREAERVFSAQVSFLADDWLDLFYSGLSIFIENYVSVGCESRLKKAYVQSAYKFRQNLSLEKLFVEQNVQNELRNCLSSFARYVTNELMIAKATDEVNDYISSKAWRVRGRVDKIAIDQMKAFFIALLKEMPAFLDKVIREAK